MIFEIGIAIEIETVGERFDCGFDFDLKRPESSRPR
jgi:hypothetical protein